MPWIIPAIIISYLIGSMPTAYIFGRLIRGIDIRQYGSGNVGATNALRVLGKPVGITVLILDALKGFATVYFLGNFIVSRTALAADETLRIILGLSCIAGHNWTLFLKFKGGKGVATSLGVLLGLAMLSSGLKIIFALVILTWIVAFIITRLVSLASVSAAVALPLYMIIFKQPKARLFFIILLSLVVILRHKSNLIRFFQGKEKRLF